MSNLLKNLNEQQKKAILKVNGPILILAGAGSGKTTVLTRKIAYTIENNYANDYELLAFTFTNKAANEMKERVSLLLEKDVKSMWIGTFHSICSRILRRDIDKLGYKNNFTIYDTQDSKNLIKSIIKELNINEENLNLNNILSKISDYKNRMIIPSQVIDSSRYPVEKQIGQIYELYEKYKKNNNSLDFDDLIVLTIKLLIKFDDIREFYLNKFKYVFVDEYQDTNNLQYKLIGLFVEKNKNICVVGDGDQSIYSWRGADITNILNFEKDFPNAEVIILEQNYRSTNSILKAANELIKNNNERKEKNLWSDKKLGEIPIYRNSNNEYEEAENIVLKIEQMHHLGYNFENMAILYRINSQSRVIEEKLMNNHIPYKIIGGLKFYDRKEVKDILAYLSFIGNSEDNLALSRIINIPKRGIGNTTIQKLYDYAQSTNQSMYNAIFDVDLEHHISKSSLKKLLDFGNNISYFINLKNDYLITELVEEVYEKSGYKYMLENSTNIEDKSRIENIEQLISAVSEFEKNNEEASLDEYLQNVNLLSDVDKTTNNKGINLMTIHASKGLEYDVVFLAGMEEGLFPSLRTIEEGGLEEERRLAYVALTRAKERLFISSAATRLMYGRTQYTKKSRFIDEIQDFIEVEISKELKNNMNYYNYNFNFELKREKIKQEIRERYKNQNQSSISYKVGDNVKHKKFGIGMVISISDNSENQKEVLVNFEKFGLKRLNPILAKLEKV